MRRVRYEFSVLRVFDRVEEDGGGVWEVSFLGFPDFEGFG